jgi:hypothetical protein
MSASALPQVESDYTRRSKISAIAFAGLRCFGQALVQFMMVWQRGYWDLIEFDDPTDHGGVEQPLPVGFGNSSDCRHGSPYTIAAPHHRRGAVAAAVVLLLLTSPRVLREPLWGRERGRSIPFASIRTQA